MDKLYRIIVERTNRYSPFVKTLNLNKKGISEKNVKFLKFNYFWTKNRAGI